MSGRRYLESPGNGWQFQLLVRARKGDAYRACGRVSLERARLFREFSVLRGV